MLKPLRTAPSLSAERAALAAAIAERDGAAARLTALRGRAEGWASPASQGVRQAEAALQDAEEAEERAARDRANAAAGLPALAAQTAAEARGVARAAEDALADAQRARDALVAQIEPAAHDLTWKRGVARRAAEAVIVSEVSPHAAAMVAKFRQLQRELRITHTALNWLELQGAAPRHCSVPANQSSLDGAEPWRAALEALQRDAMAPLPASGD